MAIEVDSKCVKLRCSVRADFIDFKAALDSKDLLTAASLLTGEFLSTAKDIAGEDLEDWRIARHAYFVHALKVKLDPALGTARSARNGSVTAQLAVEAVRIFPEDPCYAEALIESYLMLGRVEDARATWDDHQARATAGLARPFTANWSDVSAKTRELPATRKQAFVGRTKELAALQDAWLRCQKGNVELVIVQGSAGIGKTSLCEQFTNALQDAHVVLASAHKGEEHLAFNVLATVMQKAFGPSKAAERLAAPLLSALVDAFPELPVGNSSGATPLVYEAAQRRVYEAAARVIAFLADERPVALFLDDIQWADKATLGWLTYATRRLGDSRVLVVLTKRTRAENKTVGSTLQAVLSRVNRPIELNELSEADVRQLVNDTRPDLRSTDAAAELFRLTRGHPLLLSAALQEGLTDGRLTRSPELRYLASEVARLPRRARTAVEVLAAIAAPTPVGVLTELLELPSKAILDVVERISFVCEVNSANEIDFRHDLVREAVYASFPREKLQLLHSQIAEFYERKQESPALITRHYWEAGRKRDAARFVVEAAASCELKHAFDEADHFYRLALEAVTESTELRRVLERHAEMLFRAGQHKLAAPAFRTLIDQDNASEHDTIRWRARYLDACWAARLLPTTELRPQLHQLRDAAAVAQHDEGYLVASKLLLAMPFSSEEAYDIQSIRDELIQLGEKVPLSRIGVGALCYAGRVFTQEDSSLAVHYLKLAANWAEQLRDLDLLVVTGRCLGTALYDAGFFQEAYAVLRKLARTIDQHGATYYLADIADAWACILVEFDDAEEARRWLTLPPANVGTSLARMANAAVLEYHLGNFAECIAKCEDFPDSYVNVAWHEIPVRGLRGLSAIELGRVEEAQSDARRVEALLKTFDGRFGEVSFAILLIARMAGFNGDQARVRPLIEFFLTSYEKRDFVCRQRMRLALAEVLPMDEAPRAIDMCADVIRIADDNGLVPLGTIARSVQRRVKRRSTGVRTSSARLR